MFLLGYDLGSSSVKAALVDARSGKAMAITQYPESEMSILSPQIGWAEQEPEIWWENIQKVTEKILKVANLDSSEIVGVGISYQMHGLVVVDSDHRSLRPSIIWCDSRAVSLGEEAFHAIGTDKCLSHLLNSPGNFTASKLKWVKDNEPDLFSKIHKIMLPGDFIAMKMTGEIKTTITGLSEGMLWDFEDQKIASFLLDYYGIPESFIPDLVDAVGPQGKLTATAASVLGLPAGIPVGYRAGDQPNNAMSLGVLNAGEVAATGGTSGVVYGVVDQPTTDEKTRVNSFAHINYSASSQKVGVLLCINGAGIQYSWLKRLAADRGVDYTDMEKMAAEIAIGADGLRIIPFGNGAERVLENRNIGSHMINIQFNRHSSAHLFRAGLEGIAFSFVYGIEIMKEMGLDVGVIRVGNDNLFQSEVFATTIATLVGCEIQMVNTTGAVGAAKAAGVAAGCFDSIDDAFREMETVEIYRADSDAKPYVTAYKVWKSDLEKLLKEHK